MKHCYYRNTTTPVANQRWLKGFWRRGVPPSVPSDWWIQCWSHTQFHVITATNLWWCLVPILVFHSNYLASFDLHLVIILLNKQRKALESCGRDLFAKISIKISLTMSQLHFIRNRNSLQSCIIQGWFFHGEQWGVGLQSIYIYNFVAYFYVDVILYFPSIIYNI